MSETTQKPASAEEIAEVIAGLEQYRQRIIDDNLKMAKLVKLPKKVVMAQLDQHPDIVKIDAELERLRSLQGGHPIAPSCSQSKGKSPTEPPSPD